MNDIRSRLSGIGGADAPFKRMLKRELVNKFLHLFVCQKFNEILAARFAYFSQNSCRGRSSPKLSILYQSLYLSFCLSFF